MKNFTKFIIVLLLCLFPLKSQLIDNPEYTNVGSKGLPVSKIEAGTPVIDNISMLIFTSGDILRINGKNFGTSQNNSFVSFNGVKSIKYPTWTDTYILVTVPENIQTGNVTVTVDGVQSNGIKYTYQSKFKLLSTVTIKAGTFMMGDDGSSDFDNKPAHEVTISRDFEISTTEITQQQWKKVMDGSNPSHVNDTGDFKPVQQVTFQRAAEFCNRLSVMEGFPPVYTIDGEDLAWNMNAIGYRLPTEAEWEYAARAGKTTKYTSEEIQEMAWVSENAGGRIHDVSQRKPNEWGLYDMFGNVNEWCWDYYDSEFYSSSPKKDPSGPASSSFNDRIIRGGTSINGSDACNSAVRGSFPAGNGNVNFNLGFRIIRNNVPLGVGRDESEKMIVISPNPATDYIETKVPVGVQLAVPNEVEIYSIEGILMQSTSLQPSPFSERAIQIDVSGFVPGVYFVKVGDRVQRFVKI